MYAISTLPRPIKPSLTVISDETRDDLRDRYDLLQSVARTWFAQSPTPRPRIVGMRALESLGAVVRSLPHLIAGDGLALAACRIGEHVQLLRAAAHEVQAMTTSRIDPNYLFQKLVEIDDLASWLRNSVEFPS